GRIRGVVFCADDLLASLEDSNEREALRRLYAGVLDHLPLELTLMDSEERIIYLTPALVPDPKVRSSVQGLYREQVSRTLGRSEEQLEHWKGRFEAVRRSHKAVQWEETAADTQGLRSMLRCIQPVLSAQGEIEMFIGYSLDLTEQKQAQLEREQALQLYQSLFDNATEGIYQSTPQGTMLRANPALVRFNGYHTEAELLEAVQDIAVEWYVEAGRREEFVRQLEAHGQVTLFESEVYCHKTRERVWISESARAVQGESGQVLYFEGTVQDITARKVAELEREEAALVYKQLFENIPHPIYRSTPDGRMIASNPALVRFNGYNSEAEQIAAVQVGMGEWYVDPSRYSLFRDLLERNGEVRALESEVYRHRSGERTWVSESAWALRDESGQVLYYEGIVQDISARKEAELEREEALSMFRSLFENATEGIYQTNAAGQMVRANPALVRANNSQSEAEFLEQVRLLGEVWYALPGQREKFRSLMAQFGRVDALESEVIPYGSSERRWVSESAWSVFDDSGHFLYYEGFVQDITARKEAEAQLEAEKRLLEGVVETSPNPIFLRTATAQMVLVNPAMLALNQQTEEEFYSGQGQIHPNNPAEFAQWFENDRIMLERGEGMTFEEQFTLLSGEVKVYSTVKAPFRRDDGEVLVLGISSDITDLRRGEAWLRRIEQAVESVSDAILIFEADKLVFANKTALEQCGYSLEQLQHGALFKMVPPEVMLPLLESLQHQERFQGETVLQAADGRDVTVLIRSSRIRDAAGEWIGSVVTMTDISEGKRIEQPKDDFVATVSHELRTPLTSISGALGLLAAGVLGEISAEQRPMLDIAHQNAERLIALVGDLLDMQKMEGEGLSLRPVPLELESVLEQTLLEMAPYANTLGVLLTLELMTFADGLRKRVSGDRGRLLQVLTNLISNACKFSSAGQTVRVRLLERPDTLRVEVEDGGSGIPEAFRGHIFEKFAQADASSTRAKGGTGLGLAISRAIIERHGGQIGFRTLTVGTLFYFELPKLEG
ncbi:MAG: PAS domain S-box protein, partial [Pseudopedobacter sp.]|nr:PAS domain S-box protein [Deinococcales bacterium]